ncbi:MAG: hypothetical protein ACLU3I_05705 [Acutalibacteraceae bacterium]
MDIQQVKPLSLSDLALKDGVELDKREVAAIVGVTPYMLGVGNYSDADHSSHDPDNGDVHREHYLLGADARSCCCLRTGILRCPSADCTATRSRIWPMFPPSLYVKGIMSGNESRDWLDLSPVDGLDERVILENYIPANMIGNQKKLEQGGEGNGE